MHFQIKAERVLLRKHIHQKCSLEINIMDSKTYIYVYLLVYGSTYMYIGMYIS